MEDFDIVQMEWGFIPHYLKTRDDVFKMRNGYKDAIGRFRPGIITLNAICEELLMPGKIYKNRQRIILLRKGESGLNKLRR